MLLLLAGLLDFTWRNSSHQPPITLDFLPAVPFLVGLTLCVSSLRVRSRREQRKGRCRVQGIHATCCARSRVQTDVSLPCALRLAAALSNTAGTALHAYSYLYYLYTVLCLTLFGWRILLRSTNLLCQADGFRLPCPMTCRTGAGV